MSLSSTEISQVVDELQALVGGTVQKIWTPTPRVVVLELRVPGATHRLLISAEPNETRILRATDRASSPENPYAFQGLLRAHLLPSRITAIRALEGERIVRIEFRTQEGARALVGELTGRHGNLILLEDQRILGLAVPSRSTTRPMRRGDLLTPPPPLPQQERPSRFTPDEREPFSISKAIEAHYLPLERDRELREDRRLASRLLANAKKRDENALRKLSLEASRAKNADQLQRYGELLKPLVGRIPRGAASVLATDYLETGPVAVEIPLRKELSGKENLERYFKDYRRMVIAADRIEVRKRELSAELEKIADLDRRLQEAESAGELEDLLREARGLAKRPTQKKEGKRREEPKPPYRIFRSATGRLIWVGRGAKENDRLTFRHAKGNDLWLHARGFPGAHVVIPLERGVFPDQETLLDASALSAHFSGARGEAVAEVAHTLVKHVRKPKGSAAGAVAITQEKAFAYRLDEGRLKRLLETERA